MSDLIDGVTFEATKKDASEILIDMHKDIVNAKNPVFVGICLGDVEEGKSISVRHTANDSGDLMVALQGAINMYFVSHQKPEEVNNED